MLTKQDCINVGRAIDAGAAIESDNNHNEPNIMHVLYTAAWRALMQLWEDVFDARQRAYFNYDFTKFREACNSSKDPQKDYC